MFREKFIRAVKSGCGSIVEGYFKPRIILRNILNLKERRWTQAKENSFMHSMKTD